MASFTDQISTFNPYVAQLPVEAMTKVGMYKQQQYDQGVQKIQNQIDNVAGIDLVKDPDKSMLQSKLNELGSRLKTVAAGDFSNNQLVNSVGGMATQIIKDKDVQTAISSTASYKKKMQILEQDTKKTGGANVYNKDKFLRETQNWLNDGQAGTAYTADYTEHKDVYKTLVEIGKTVGVDSTTINNLFVTDANGNPALKDGALQYNDVMAETLLKGKDKGKLLQAFQAGLSPADYKQLAINGEYELKNKTPEELTGMLDNTFKDYQKNALLKKQSIQDKIIELKCTVFDAKEQPLADEKIKELEDSLVVLDNNLSKKQLSTEQMKAANPDSIRSSIYTNNFLDSVSDALSEKETYTKYTKNPAVEIMLDKERLKLSASIEQRMRDEFRYKQSRDITQDELEKWKVLFGAGLVDEKGNPTGATALAGGRRSLAINDITNPTYFTTKFQEGLKTDKDVQFGLYEKVAVADWLTKNSGKVDPVTGKAFSETGMKNQILKYAKKLGMSYNDYIVLQGQKAVDKFNYSKTPTIGNENLSAIKEINSLSKLITSKVAKEQEADQYVKENAVGFQPFDYKKANIKPQTITVPVIKNGRVSSETVNLSTEDLYKFAVIAKAGDEPGDIIPGPSAFRPIAKREEAIALKNSLIAKYGEQMFRTIQKTMYTGPKVPLIGMTTPLTPMLNALESDAFKKTNALKEQFYKKITDVQAPFSDILYRGKPEQEKQLASNISDVVSEYATAGISGYDEFNQYTSDPKAQFRTVTNPAVDKYGKNAYSLQLTKPDGGIVEKPITEAHYEFLTNKSAPSIFEDEVKSAINAFSTGSTNPSYHYTDKNAYTTAFLKPDDFPNTNKYKVATDFAPGGNGRYFPKLYINAGAGYKFYNYNPGPSFQGFTAREADDFSTKVDDIFISGLLQRK